jgi:hypothetical protein
MSLTYREKSLIKGVLLTMSIFAVAVGIGQFLAYIMAPTLKVYTIKTEQETYHTDSFRIYGRGVIFDAGNERVIVMGNFEIKKNLTSN